MIIVASVLTKTHSTTRFFAVCERNRGENLVTSLVSLLTNKPKTRPLRDPMKSSASSVFGRCLSTQSKLMAAVDFRPKEEEEEDITSI